MSRTTLDIDDPLLRDLKRLQRIEKKSLGALVSELLAQALASRRKAQRRPAFRWHAQEVGLHIDLADKDALWAVLEDDALRKLPR